MLYLSQNLLCLSQNGKVLRLAYTHFALPTGFRVAECKTTLLPTDGQREYNPISCPGQVSVGSSDSTSTGEIAHWVFTCVNTCWWNCGWHNCYGRNLAVILSATYTPDWSPAFLLYLYCYSWHWYLVSTTIGFYGSICNHQLGTILSPKHCGCEFISWKGYLSVMLRAVVDHYSHFKPITAWWLGRVFW